MLRAEDTVSFECVLGTKDLTHELVHATAILFLLRVNVSFARYDHDLTAVEVVTTLYRDLKIGVLILDLYLVLSGLDLVFRAFLSRRSHKHVFALLRRRLE